VASCCRVKKYVFVCATASGTSGVIGSGFASNSPRIQGSGPGAGSGAAWGGIGGGADGATEAGAFCPIIARALTDAASIAFTNSRRRISLLLVIRIGQP
jgi:hypothetical protein